MRTKYIRAQHAGHYTNGPDVGHDLEIWEVEGEKDRTGIPTDAEYHSGSLNRGVQTWRYVRRAPMTGTCARCDQLRGMK